MIIPGGIKKIGRKLNATGDTPRLVRERETVAECPKGEWRNKTSPGERA